MAGVSLMNAVAMMIAVPVLPQLVETFTGGMTSAAYYVGVFAALFAAMQFFASPLLGSLSDRFGRRAVILASAFGQACNFVLMALAPDLAWLFAARIIGGVTSGSLSAVNAYIADVTPPSERAGSYGWVSAANSAGFLLGPALGGLLGEVNLRLPFWVSGALCLANVLYGAVVMRESLKREQRPRLSLARANPISALRFLGSHAVVQPLAVEFMMLMLAQQCLPNTIVLYTDYRFGWSPAQIGAYLTAVGVANMLVQGFVLRPFVRRFGERTAVLVGFSCYAAAFTIYATAPVGRIFVLGAPLFALGGMVTPSIQAQLSRIVAVEEQGRLQGSFATLTSLCGLFTPILYTQVFGFAVGPGRGVMPAGTHIFLATAFLVVGAGLARRHLSAR